jgi:hypothetical protein
MGAVVGYSEQKSVVVLGSDDDVAVFLKARTRRRSFGLWGSGGRGAGSAGAWARAGPGAGLGPWAASRSRTKAPSHERAALRRDAHVPGGPHGMEPLPRRPPRAPVAPLASAAQDKRSLKMGLDFGLSLGKKVNHAATVDPQTAKKAAEGEARTRAFTISKCARAVRRSEGGRPGRRAAGAPALRHVRGVGAGRRRGRRRAQGNEAGVPHVVPHLAPRLPLAESASTPPGPRAPLHSGRCPPSAPTRPLGPFPPCRPQRGFIVDVSLKGTSLEHDVDDMEAAYGEGTTPADVLQARARARRRRRWGMRPPAPGARQPVPPAPPSAPPSCGVCLSVPPNPRRCSPPQGSARAPRQAQLLYNVLAQIEARAAP